MTSTYNRIRVQPLSGALGAEIEGVDASREQDEETVREIRRAFAEHLVVFFRNQTLTPEQQTRFAAVFGPLTRHPFIKTMPEHPYVAPLIRDADASGPTFGGDWHCDATFLEEAPLGSLLYAVEIPPYGGDTCFANLILAYEKLSAGMREMLDTLILIHSAAGAYDPDIGNSSAVTQTKQKGIGIEVTDDPRKEMEHPLVRTHRESGRKALWIPGAYGMRFKGWTPEESKSLLDYLYQHVSKPHFTCRFRWQAGSLAMWDNRATQHIAINDYSGFRRVMHRVQVGGERPFGPAMPLAKPLKAA